MLRDYGSEGQLGLEARVDEWVENLRAVVAGVARVLKPTGSLWLNIGDSYSRGRRYGSEPKSLLLAGERLVLALMTDGWIVRNKVVWSKSNPMPHSVRDRLNTTYEFVYFLVRSRDYYFSLNEIREPHRSKRRPSPLRPSKYIGGDRQWAGPLAGSNSGLAKAQAEGRTGHPLGANPGDVWRLATGGYKGAHFATFPERLVTRPLLASCPERVCQACGRPWRRQVSTNTVGTRRPAGDDQFVRRNPTRWLVLRQLGDLYPGCTCHGEWLPGVVLDPFFGSGTIGVVAENHGRDWVGIELNPDYAKLAEERIRAAREKRERAA
jgi:DNA modification methylase